MFHRNNTTTITFLVVAEFMRYLRTVASAGRVVYHTEIVHDYSLSHKVGHAKTRGDVYAIAVQERAEMPWVRARVKVMLELPATGWTWSEDEAYVAQYRTVSKADLVKQLRVLGVEPTKLRQLDKTSVKTLTELIDQSPTATSAMEEVTDVRERQTRSGRELIFPVAMGALTFKPTATELTVFVERESDYRQQLTYTIRVPLADEWAALRAKARRELDDAGLTIVDAEVSPGA